MKREAVTRPPLPFLFQDKLSHKVTNIVLSCRLKRAMISKVLLYIT